jgi:hypothetical protein
MQALMQKAKTLLSGLATLMTTAESGRTEAAARAVLQHVNKEEDIEDRLKLDLAKKALGRNWVMHPEYTPIPRHSNHHDIWWPNRTLKYPEVRYSKERMSPAARAARPASRPRYRTSLWPDDHGRRLSFEEVAAPISFFRTTMRSFL